MRVGFSINMHAGLHCNVPISYVHWLLPKGYGPVTSLVYKFGRSKSVLRSRGQELHVTLDVHTRAK